MTRSIRAALVLVAALALAIGVAACGSDSSSSSDSGSSSGGSSSSATLIKKNSANSGKTVTIGTKNFPEQYILGEILKQSLEAAGYTVKNKGSLGSEVVAFKALKGGQVQAYPEYTGTALTSFYKVKVTDVPKDPAAAYNELKPKLAKDGITGLPQAPFDNTYRLGMTKATAAKVGNPTTISDLKGKSQSLTINGFPECQQRPDCLLGVEKTYGLKFKKFVASGDPYPVLDKGSADVAFVFTTDAALTTGKYAILDDDKHLFPPYHITYMFRTDALKKLGPDVQATVVKVQKPLTNKVQRELNSRVVLDKQKPADVAHAYLKAYHFVK
jgi:glycine betaine/choline ABC-type transport system substrate-binding protein